MTKNKYCHFSNCFPYGHEHYNNNDGFWEFGIQIRPSFFSLSLCVWVCVCRNKTYLIRSIPFDYLFQIHNSQKFHIPKMLSRFIINYPLIFINKIYYHNRPQKEEQQNQKKVHTSKEGRHV